MKKKVSVIVPIYNVEKYLKCCVDSIINQTYKNLEIILVDDGSTDNSPKICDEYKNIDDRIVVIHKKNGGLSSARNAGIDIITGDYLYFVDSDDYINSHCIEILMKETDDGMYSIVACGVQNVSEIDIEEKDYDEKYISKTYESISACNSIYDNPLKDLRIMVWNKLYSKNIFKKLRFCDGLIHEDEAIIYQLLFESNNIKYIDTNLHYYRYNETSITRTKFSKKRFDILRALKIRIEFLIDKNKELLLKNYTLYLHLLAYYKYLSRKFSIDYELIDFDKEIDLIYQLKKKYSVNLKDWIIYHFRNIYGFIVYLKNLIKK